MIQMNDDRTTVVLYTCGVCNLNCRYCTIDKNPILKDIDNLLEESFQGDYYFNRIKEYFPRKDQLKRIETWGGEPFLKMERIHPLIHKIIEYYPYFNEMFSSTNFAYDGWVDKFIGLMNCFKEYPHRQFKYTLQLSVDGPEYINDANRGNGVTKKCIENFDKLLEIIKAGEFPSNVYLTFEIKGTWDIDCIRKLNSKEKLIEFFQFYEDAYIHKVRILGVSNVSICETIPNTAVPAPVTQEDGQIFAELVKKCREIEGENQIYKYFKYYTRITPFTDSSCMNCLDYRGNRHNCGSGSCMLGLLPHNMVSACHEGFVQLVEKYKEMANQRSDEKLTVQIDKFLTEHPVPMCMTDDGYLKHEQKMATYNDISSSAQTATTVGMIIALAMAGQIDKKYLNEYNAIAAAQYLACNTAYCIKNNYAVTGSFILESVDLYKLMLNGALDYLTQGGAWYNGESSNNSNFS